MLRRRLKQILKNRDAEQNAELGAGDGKNFPEEEAPPPPSFKLPAGLGNISLDDFMNANFNVPTAFNRRTTKITHPRQISRDLLTPIEVPEMTNWLDREDGQVTPPMIVKMAFWFGIELDERIVKLAIQPPNTLIPCTKDSDSEPEPGGSSMDIAKEAKDEAELQAKKDIICQLKKELHALYRDYQRKANEVSARARQTPVEPELPSYKQKSRQLAGSLSEFNRMANAPLFTSQRDFERFSAGSYTGSQRLASRLGTMSLSGITDTDETMSTISKTSGWSTKMSGDVATLVLPVAPQRPDNAQWHPLKDPAVFQNFYPSEVPADTRNLPVFAHKATIRDLIASRKVTIISGMTGTGKSTQVPLMVLDHCAKEGLPCNIVVTQPRRLAAIGVARRVCQERNWSVGQLVGYQVGFDRNISAATRLTYCTTGVFVEKIVAAKHLNQFTHVFLDEIHERDQDTDMALMLTRQMLQENSPDVKVILMSATFELERISNYFSTMTNSFARDDRPGKVSVDVSNHMIHETYLDEFCNSWQRHAFYHERPQLPRDLMAVAVSTLNDLTPLPGQGPDNVPSVLVFLPGLEHIQDMEEMIKAKYPKAEVMVLHSTINKEDQSSVLEPPRKGVDRVILSTNIAESSVTIPYIDYVFDFCLTKTLRCSAKTKIPQLTIEWASAANCQQRKGRVGRLRQGKVYFFVPRQFFKLKLPRYPMPEILISPIENSVLRVKLLSVTPPPLEVFVKMLDPPAPTDIELGILTLKEIGALTVNHNGTPSYSDGDLTLLGNMIARLPMDVRTAKFLVLCAMFGYPEEGVTIAAGMSIESVLCGNNRTPERYKILLDLYHRGVSSDALALLYAYQRWSAQNFTALFTAEQRQWCEDNIIDHTRMKELVALRRELLQRLNQRVYEVPCLTERPPVERMIPILLAGAFYPNVLTYQTHVDDLAIGKELAGYDPLNTCIIDQFGTQTSLIAPLYDAQLKRVLKLNVSSDSIAQIIYDTHQTYISFTKTSWSGAATNVHPGLAILRKRLDTMKGRIPLSQQVLALRDEEESGKKFLKTSRVTTLKASLTRYAVEDGSLRIPPPDLNFRPGEQYEVVISSVENIASFWIGLWKDDHTQIVNMEDEFHDLGIRQELRRVKPEDISPNGYYLGSQPHSETVDQPGLEYARVKVLSPIRPDGKVLVQLIDTGEFDALSVSWLFVLPAHARDISRAAFEFRFSGIRFVQPVEALKLWRSMVNEDGANTVLEVFSVLDGVVRGELFWSADCTNGHKINVNKEFVKLGYAFRGRESWISEYDHKSRSAPVMGDPLPSSIDPVYEQIPEAMSTDVTFYGGPVRFPNSARLAQIRRDKLALDNQLVGSISGLGPYPGKPYSFYQDTEVDLAFDARFDADDISQIQNLRAEMGLVLVKLSEQNQQTSRETVLELQKRLSYGLIRLLDKPRLPVDRPTHWGQYNWSLMDPLALDPKVAGSFLLPMEVPLINAASSSSSGLFGNITALHRSLQKMMFGKTVTSGHPTNAPEGMEHRCLLCSTQLAGLNSFLDHLYSSEHITREEAVIGQRPRSRDH
ncbi:hypothetical protein RvY_05043-2 [Ramazzottius varieornatus]|uniref:RNA helicase n=1 Tax=Ramazzottius varieornatus TaxID=947166 RepID=A0A1D1UZF7_RAMVA|nr:hypothetical protein RvY_05043-2 [Ramazzottius varieornatus]